MASDVDHVGVGGDDIFELMVMILRMIRADGTKKWCLMMMMRQQLMNMFITQEVDFEGIQETREEKVFLQTSSLFPLVL